jgi:hypothetical protein
MVYDPYAWKPVPLSKDASVKDIVIGGLIAIVACILAQYLGWPF